MDAQQCIFGRELRRGRIVQYVAFKVHALVQKIVESLYELQGKLPSSNILRGSLDQILQMSFALGGCGQHRVPCCSGRAHGRVPVPAMVLLLSFANLINRV